MRKKSIWNYLLLAVLIALMLEYSKKAQKADAAALLSVLTKYRKTLVCVNGYKDNHHVFCASYYNVSQLFTYLIPRLKCPLVNSNSGSIACPPL